MNRKTIVFDLDGTLVNTAEDILESLDFCLEAAGLAPADPRDLHKFVGQGGRVMIERAFQLQRRELDPETHERLLSLFLEHYRANIPGRSQPYEGAADAVTRFREYGYRTAICTNKFESLSVALISALGMEKVFDAICGSDTFAFRKPDPRHLVETISRAGGDPSAAVMVGDSRTDIDTALAAGIPVVAVDFGFSDIPVADLKPTHVISHFRELTPSLAERLFIPVQ